MAATRVIEPQHVRPREAASGEHNGDVFVINPSEIFAADHPLVRAYPHLFIALEQNRERPTWPEQATAAPGEKRAVPIALKTRNLKENVA